MEKGILHSSEKQDMDAQTQNELKDIKVKYHALLRESFRDKGDLLSAVFEAKCANRSKESLNRSNESLIGLNAELKKFLKENERLIICTKIT